METDIQIYIERKKLAQELLLQLIESNNDLEENFENFIDYINGLPISTDINEMKSIISLIMKVVNNHTRSTNFFDKIFRILDYLKIHIKQMFTNNEIFDLFKSNKLILLYLIKSDVIYIDEKIESILEKGKFKKDKYKEYLNLSTEKNQQTENSIDFERNQIEGENELHICKIIQKDMIDDFTAYVKKMKFPLDALVKTSIFETNSFLLKREPALIEYTAFFGSIQIFKYLKRNKIPLTSSLWEYAIHGNKQELLDILIKSKIVPKDKTYRNCLEESIKCHHISITNYILENLIDNYDEICNQNNKFNKNIHYYSFRYHNYIFFPTDVSSKFLFFYACQFNYYTLVDYYLRFKSVNINEKIISS
ncbi:hypothetical protein M9Y10_021514 [Tritrichomonas musculus]|uniref:DUF3447 domain-containing protein n=1 Tax=Tritrichomonas musculus TaxID=1915356 RepID=A0ABR2KPR7_9EUKA